MAAAPLLTWYPNPGLLPPPQAPTAPFLQEGVPNAATEGSNNPTQRCPPTQRCATQQQPNPTQQQPKATLPTKPTQGSNNPTQGSPPTQPNPRQPTTPSPAHLLPAELWHRFQTNGVIKPPVTKPGADLSHRDKCTLWAQLPVYCPSLQPMSFWAVNPFQAL